MKIIIKLAPLWVLAVLVGCGGGKPTGGKDNPAGPTDKPAVIQSLNGADYLFLDQGSLETTGKSIAGTGELVFKAPMGGKDRNFTLKFELGEGGVLTIKTHGDNKLKDGLSTIFTRNKNRLIDVKVDVVDVTPELNLVSNLPVSLNMDVHQHGHAVFWVDGGTQDEEISFDIRPHGEFWGLSLKNAKVTQALVGEAKDKH